jgi:hypothetical protein
MATKIYKTVKLDFGLGFELVPEISNKFLAPIEEMLGTKLKVKYSKT